MPPWKSFAWAVLAAISLRIAREVPVVGDFWAGGTAFAMWSVFVIAVINWREALRQK